MKNSFYNPPLSLFLGNPLQRFKPPYPERDTAALETLLFLPLLIGTATAAPLAQIEVIARRTHTVPRRD